MPKRIRSRIETIGNTSTPDSWSITPVRMTARPHDTAAKRTRVSPKKGLFEDTTGSFELATSFLTTKETPTTTTKVPRIVKTLGCSARRIIAKVVEKIG